MAKATVSATDSRVPGSPSFFNGTAADLAEWIEALPMDDARETALRVRRALLELNSLTSDFSARFRQLEALRPVVHFVCGAPGGRSALMVGETDRAEALLAQALQAELARGYRLVLDDGLDAGLEIHAGVRANSRAGLVVVALHRALTELGHTLLRSLQRYIPPPPRLWAQLHELFEGAERHGVLDSTVLDPENALRERTRIVDAYLRPVMLGAARPNTLRPGRLGVLFNVLEDWTRFVLISAEASDEGVHAVVDLATDEPPVSAAADTPFDGQALRALDATELLDELQGHLDGKPRGRRGGPVMPEADTDDLVRHALHAWGVVRKRVFRRMPITGRLELCAGMPAIHYHVAGGVSFDERLSGRTSGKERKTPTRFRLFALTLADASPGGYGLLCDGDIPTDLQTGDLLGVRKEGSQEWHIAAVRWFGNGADGARLGVELLAPRAEPAGARRVASRGATDDWTPVLLLPELHALRQPPALICPRGEFRLGQKLALNRGGRESKVRLDASRSFTDNFHQFSLRELGASTDLPDTGILVDYLDDEHLDQFRN